MHPDRLHAQSGLTAANTDASGAELLAVLRTGAQQLAAIGGAGVAGGRGTISPPQGNDGAP